MHTSGTHGRGYTSVTRLPVSKYCRKPVIGYGKALSVSSAQGRDRPVTAGQAAGKPPGMSVNRDGQLGGFSIDHP